MVITIELKEHAYVTNTKEEAMAASLKMDAYIVGVPI